MNLYKISQTANRAWDTYDSAVVAAPDEDTARYMDPGSGKPIVTWAVPYGVWCQRPKDVVVELLAVNCAVTEPGVICASFNAG